MQGSKRFEFIYCASSIFPEKLKAAKVITIFKKDDPLLTENYRTISFLRSISKIVDKIICNRLNDNFDVNKLFHSSQYGFRKQYSTELAAMELANRVTLEMERGEIPFGIFLVFQKLFTR